MIEQRFTVFDSPLGTALALKPEWQPRGDSFRLLQLTDCHLGEKPGERLAGMNTDESLELVLDMLLAEQRGGEHCDLVLATGDLANHGSAAAYQRLQQKLAVLEAPSAWLPGNHDSYELMVETVGPLQAPKMVVLGRWHIILLDSAVPGKVGGRIGPSQMQKLREQLASIADDAYIIVALHHQPVPIGSEWIDQQRVEDGDILIDVLAGDQRLKAVVWGHVHQAFEARAVRLGDVQLIASPSTCIQFAPKLKNFKLHDDGPGYRWLQLDADGRFSSGVERLQGVAIEQDLQSSGY